MLQPKQNLKYLRLRDYIKNLIGKTLGEESITLLDLHYMLTIALFLGTKTEYYDTLY